MSAHDQNGNPDLDITTDWIDTLSQRDKRALIFHVLYAAEGYDYQIDIQSLIKNFNKGFELKIPLKGSLVDTVKPIIDNRHQLDQTYEPYLANWRIERIGVCTKLILRYAIWELLYTQTDHTIIINEAIELAKCFAEKDSYKFVNGILDEIAKKLPERTKPTP